MNNLYGAKKRVVSFSVTANEHRVNKTVVFRSTLNALKILLASLV